jgi:hypothetical protein
MVHIVTARPYVVNSWLVCILSAAQTALENRTTDIRICYYHIKFVFKRHVLTSSASPLGHIILACDEFSNMWAMHTCVTAVKT